MTVTENYIIYKSEEWLIAVSIKSVKVMILNGDSWFLCRYPWQCLQQSFVKVATRSGTWLCGCPSFWASQSPSSPTSMTITSEMSFCPFITEDWNFVCTSIRVKNFQKENKYIFGCAIQVSNETWRIRNDYFVFKKHNINVRLFGVWKTQRSWL